MMTTVAFLLFLGLIVFGPKKTIELAQEVGRMVAHVKRTAGQFTSLDQIAGTQMSIKRESGAMLQVAPTEAAAPESSLPEAQV